LAEAESASPGILAARARAAAAQHVPSQMEALPDPLASVSYINETFDRLTLGSSVDSVLTFSWQQEVPWPGKRRLAGDVARGEAVVAGHGAELVRVRVLAGIKAFYAELHRLDRTSTILTESRKLLESFLASARIRYESGGGILENVLRAQTELTRLDADQAEIAGRRRAAAANLNVLVGREEDAPVGPAQDPLETTAAEPAALEPAASKPAALEPAASKPAALEPAALEAAALDQSPELLMQLAEETRQERRLDLAHRNLKPDLMWEAAYMNRGGLDPMVMGIVGVRLPLWRNRKQAHAVEQTRLELDAARLDTKERRVALVGEVRALVSQAEQARLRMRLTEEGIIPQAQSALDSAAASYSAGRAEFITLIEDFLSLLESERDLEMLRAEEAMALVDLERLTRLHLVGPWPAEQAAAGEHHE